jgi:5-methylcytosine-specific restriction protein A
MFELGFDNTQYPGEEVLNISGNFQEGSRTTVQVSRVERSAEARKKCLAKFGCQCQACGMTFSERYGPIAAGFIHGRHKYPGSQRDKSSAINPEEDLIPLCPNCHAVAHMRKDEPYSVEEIKAMLNDG